jgi:hypothetical protein
MIKLNLAPERRVLAQFAWVAAIALPLLTAFVTRDTVWYRFWEWPWGSVPVLCLGGLGAAQLVAFLLGVRQPTRVLYVVLMVIALPIGFVVSHVLIALVFYLVITPIALVFRLGGRDAIGRKIDRSKASYWVDRGAPRPASSYFKLY